MEPELSFPYAVPSSLDGGNGFMDPGEKGLCIAILGLPWEVSGCHKIVQ